MNEARNNLISVCRDWEFGKKTTLLPVVAVRARYFLEHLTEPKPAEWSEEDEGMLNCIIATLCEESHGGREANGKMVTWLETRLKSPRPQLIQDKFDSAMHVADKFEEGYKAGVYDTKAKSWKPSQQQMANLINVRDHVAQASGYWGESLSSLIDDLKKL